MFNVTCIKAALQYKSEAQPHQEMLTVQSFLCEFNLLLIPLDGYLIYVYSLMGVIYFWYIVTAGQRRACFLPLLKSDLCNI